MNCPTCGNTKVHRSKILHWLDSTARDYDCPKCGRKWKDLGKQPKLLYFDIETAPIRIEADVWNIWDVSIRPENVKEDWFVLSWAAKWVCTSSMYSYTVRPKEAKNCDDKRIVKPLYDLFNEADIVIGHNSDRFDIKRMNWRWLVHGYKPPKPYRTEDTLKIARRHFGATSNSLDYLCQELGLSRKVEHRPGLFKECKEGNPDALRECNTYNVGDVIAGEALLLRIRPWDKRHVNLGLYYETDTERCKNCGSTQLDLDELKTVKTAVNEYVCWVCRNCGANGRTPESVISKDKRKALMR